VLDGGATGLADMKEMNRWPCVVHRMTLSLVVVLWPAYRCIA
jgi:hypothetical protein